MLKKLRLKFIIVNMTIVVLMLGIIFSLLYYSTSNRLEQESLQMMRAMTIGPFQITQSKDAPDDIRLPYFSVLVDREGDIIELNSGFFDLSDEDALTPILEQVQNSKKESGVLKEYNLRYLCTHSPLGDNIVFSDITSEQATLRNLIQTFVVIGSAALLGFLGISVLLARWAVRPVEKAWQQQKQFVADASHELKTPLTVIMTDAELLHAEQCTEEDRTQISGSILTMSEQMRGLVENLLEMARIDNGSVKEQKSQVSFSEIAANAAMVFEPVFFEKEMPFQYQIDPDIQLTANGTHLYQLVNILLDNAAKYGTAGGEVLLTLRRASKSKCVLEVANQGEPIDPTDLKNLFKRFYRADRARTLNHSYGLGLSIAESITTEHGGRIRAESREGYNRFIAELPL